MPRPVRLFVRTIRRRSRAVARRFGLATNFQARSLIPSATAAVLISASGIGLAMITDLTAAPVSQASVAAPKQQYPAPLATYDRSQGAAGVDRLNTPAQTKVLVLQRRYQLALQQQAIAQSVADTAAERRRKALLADAEATEQEQIRYYQEEERRRIKALVAKQLAEELRRAEQAAAAEAERLRRSGAEPPAEQPAFPVGGVSGVLPVTSGSIAAHFGAVGSWANYHTGVDFRAGYGEPVYSVADGVVTEAGNNRNWAGNYVAVRHNSGVTTMYSHLSSIAVVPGQPVSAGQIIGRVGQTGRAFGPHLHFESYPAGVRPGDVYRAVDPEPWLTSLGVNTR